ncbi:MAG: heme A synthase [Candidatus Berkiellales bacterium]
MAWLLRLSVLTIALALSVIMLGAYTRLTDAGLGCPDWPGCYGQFLAPNTSQAIAKANTDFPALPVEVKKAQTEMTHRYFAESLGFFIILFAAIAHLKRRTLPLPRWLGPTLVLLVLFQGLLGMWTVTLRLLPLVVVGHLLGGFCTLALLWLAWLYLTSNKLTRFFPSPNVLRLGLLTLFVVLIQIALGGWTSANTAALICGEFPTCQGVWFPELNFIQAFNLIGNMDAIGKTTVHMMHRLGALLILFLVSTLAVALWQQAKKIPAPAKNTLHRLSFVLIGLLILQIGLGISNVLFFLPATIAVAHNAVAALLLLSLVALNFTLYQSARSPRV